MSFGDAHVEDAVGHLVHHQVERATRRHSRRYANYLRVLLRKFDDSASEHVLVAQRLRRSVAGESLARVGVELAGCVPYRSRFLGRFVSLALHRVQVQEFRAAHVLQLVQYAHQFHHVVAVERTEVAYVHALEDVLLMGKRRLDGVVEAYESLATVVVEIALRVEPLRSAVAQAVVRGVGVEIEQVFLHAAHSVVDAHVVVVKDDEQVVGRRRYVVETLKCQSARHRAVAYYGYDVSVCVVVLMRSHSHAQRHGDGVGGVSARECVVLAFFRGRERAYAAQFAVSVELVLASGEYLVAVRLMSYVPHDAVVGRVQHVVQRHRQLHHAKRRRKVSGVDGQFLHDVLTQFGAELRQLLNRQLAEVVGILYLV